MKPLFCIALLTAAQAWGAIVTVNGSESADLPAWLISTGASPTTAFPDVGAAEVSRTVGSLTFTAVGTQMYFGLPGNPGWSSLLSGAELALNTENFDVAIDSLVYSFGFLFHEPSGIGAPPDTCGNVAACTEGTFSVSLFNGIVPVGSLQFNATNDIAAFIGVHSSLGFNRVEIREIIGDFDNEYFGRFYTGAQPLPGGPVPEPSTYALVGSGVGLAALLRRRK